MGIAPSALDRITTHHFEQQMGTATGRMHFVARRLEAWAHRAAIEATALAHSEASLGSAQETVLVIGELQIGSRLAPAKAAFAQVLIKPMGLDNLVRIHLPRWIPDLLEFGEGANQFMTEHFREKFGARLTIAMLAGERTAVAHYQI